MAYPAPVHWLGIKRILRYLRGTMTQGLTYSGANFSPSPSLSPPHNLEGWSDVDWAGDIDTRRSTSGYLFLLDSLCLISLQSKKQSVVALSTSEAEYIAATTATKELLWLQTLTSELGYLVRLPSTLYCDNQSCIAFTKNSKFHDRSKHIALRYYFLRDQVQSKVLQLQFTPTSMMWTDILTKSLPKIKHNACLEGITNASSQ